MPTKQDMPPTPEIRVSTSYRSNRVKYSIHGFRNLNIEIVTIPNLKLYKKTPTNLAAVSTTDAWKKNGFFLS